VVGTVPVKEEGGVHSTQFALMVQPLLPHVRAVDTGVGVGVFGTVEDTGVGVGVFGTVEDTGVGVGVFGTVEDTGVGVGVFGTVEDTGVGDGIEPPALVTVKPLKIKLLAEEQGTEEVHEEPSSQDILPLQTLQTGTIPV